MTSDTVDALDLTAFHASYVFSSRKIERRLYDDLAFRML